MLSVLPLVLVNDKAPLVKDEKLSVKCCGTHCCQFMTTIKQIYSLSQLLNNKFKVAQCLVDVRFFALVS